VDVVSPSRGDGSSSCCPTSRTSTGRCRVAQKLIAAISEPIDLDGQSVAVTPRSASRSSRATARRPRP
jgi:hypothetical protein